MCLCIAQTRRNRSGVYTLYVDKKQMEMKWERKRITNTLPNKYSILHSHWWQLHIARRTLHDQFTAVEWMFQSLRTLSHGHFPYICIFCPVINICISFNFGRYSMFTFLLCWLWHRFHKEKELFWMFDRTEFKQKECFLSIKI